MRRGGLSILTLLLGLLAAVYGAALLLDLAGRDERRTVRPLGDLRAVTLDTGSGEVEAVAGRGPARLEVVATGGLFGGPDVRVRRTDGGGITVDADCPGFVSVSCSADVRLVVPAATAVRLQTGSGDIAVEGLRADTSLDTGSGSVRITDVAAASLRAETGSGDVLASGVTAQDVLLDTGSGTIDVGLARPPRSVEAQTGSGDLTLTVPEAAYRVEAETGSGDEDVRVRQDPAAERRLRLRTGSGDLTVRGTRGDLVDTDAP